MLWEEVLDDSLYEATHYYYSEIRGDPSSKKNHFNVTNEFTLPFVDFRKSVSRNMLKRDSIIHLQSMSVPTNLSLMEKEEDRKNDPWIQKVVEYYNNNNFDFFSRTGLNDEAVILDWITEKVCIVHGWNLKVIDFREDMRRKPNIYHSIVQLVSDEYLKRNDDDNVFMKRTFMNAGTKWLKWNDLRSEIDNNWWNMNFPSIPYSYLPYRFWNGSFCSGISTSPLRNESYISREKNFCELELDKNKAMINFRMRGLRPQNFFWFDQIPLTKDVRIVSEPSQSDKYDVKQINSHNQYYFPLPSSLPSLFPETVRSVMNFGFIPTHSQAAIYKVFPFQQYFDFQYNSNISMYDNLHNFARQGYEKFENGKYVLRNPLEYHNLPFLFFVEHDKNPNDNTVLDMIDPERRKFTYLFSIRIEPRNKFKKSGDVEEIKITIRVSNIGHVFGKDPKTGYSYPVIVPTPFASFFEEIIQRSIYPTGVKYYYKFNKNKHLTDMTYWYGNNFIQEGHNSGRPNECMLIETMYEYLYGEDNDRIKDKHAEIESILQEWQHLLYPDKKNWKLMPCIPPRVQDFLFGISCIRLKNNRVMNRGDYSYLEVSANKDTIVSHLSIPWFRTEQNIFPIRSPQILDYFKQGLTMDGKTNIPLNGLSFEDYKNNIYLKVMCKDQWTTKWSEKDNLKWCPPLYDEFSLDVIDKKTVYNVIQFLENPVGNFKYSLKYDDNYATLLKGDFKSVKFKPYLNDKKNHLEVWIYCEQVKESYSLSVKLPLVCLGLWRKEIPSMNKTNYFRWCQAQKNLLTDNAIQQLTFYCTDIYQEPLLQRRYDGSIIDNWKESHPIRGVHLILYQPRDDRNKNKKLTNVFETMIIHRDDNSLKYESNPFTLRLSNSVVNEIQQRNSNKKFYCCVLTNIYFFPTEADNFPSEEDRWVHITFNMAEKCNVYLNNMKVEHVVASFDLNRYMNKGDKRTNISLLTNHQPLLEGQMRYFLVKDTVDFSTFSCALLNSKNEKLIFNYDIDPIFVLQWTPFF